jgi:hypothetical protein
MTIRIVAIGSDDGCPCEVVSTRGTICADAVATMTTLGPNVAEPELRGLLWPIA